MYLFPDSIADIGEDFEELLGGEFSPIKPELF
jgi:hypothetical protein